MPMDTLRPRLKLLLYLLILFIYVRAQESREPPVHALQTRQTAQLQLSEELTALSKLGQARYRGSLPLKTDYELSNLALLSSVDGRLYAIKRDTGTWLWTLHDDSSNEQDKERSAILTQPLVSSQTNVTPSAYSSGLLINKGNGQLPPLNETTQQEATPDEVYVIEPSGGGSIFLHVKSAGTTERLPLTVAELVDLSPFTFPSDDSRMFVGKRTTSLIGVDLASGKLIGVFGPEVGWCEWNGQKGMAKNEECEEGIQSRPRDMLYLGKTDYQISIISKKEGVLLQSLSFTAYHPSSLISATQQQSWQQTPDDRYFQPLHDGSLLCLKSKLQSLEWATSPFSAPIVGIFDIAYPISNDPSLIQPVLFRQPPALGSASAHAQTDALSLLPNAAYFGRLPQEQGHALYAMSRNSFPLISITTEPEASNSDQTCEGLDCLIGMHQLQDVTETRVDDRTNDGAPLPIDPHQQPLGIDAPARSQTSLLPSSAAPLTLPPATTSPSSFPVFAIYSSLVISLTALGLLWRFYRARRRRSLHFVANLIESITAWFHPPSTEAQLLQPLMSSQGASSASEIDSEKQALAEKEMPAQPRDRTYDTDKDLPPVPFINAEDLEAEGSASEDDDASPANNGSKRKTRSRRKRGKRPGQKLAAEASEKGSAEQHIKIGSLGVSDEVLGTLPFATASSPDFVASVRTGYGSHGTVVLKGNFQGRAVAVKRLLKHFVTIAEQEVALLQESDEHPNVIRYFCKEQRDNFLYIALELCPASLADIFDAPERWPTLVSAFESKRALKQIASGVAHLHSLKIVHRDLKPQNILINVVRSSSKEKDTVPTLRMLISDFGLCKKLDMDQSSFLQTVNHAAGSFGYRAPEVLRGDVNPNETLPSSSSSSRNLLEAEPSTQKTKKLTRSLDIFSLGCIFYYVLTSGEHPFGGRFEREVNILKSEFCLDRLDGLGEEAHEAQSMISSMISDEPLDRPSAEGVLLHPFFWTQAARLNFICEASDTFEVMEREPVDPVIEALEEKASEIVGSDWAKRLDRSLIDNLGKYRKYDGTSLRDLLRVIRNKKHHFLDLPENVRKNLGTPPNEFLAYFTQRFPLLFLHVWDVVKRLVDESEQETQMSSYFQAV